MTAHRTLTFAGTVYTCPFSTRFRRHTDEEAIDMRESVATDGVLVAVRVYRDTTLNLSQCILDGEGRLSQAIACGAPKSRVPFFDMGPLSTEEAYRLARALNDKRRHDDPDAIRRRRTERIERAVAARSAGKSLRDIAAAEGVSEKQIREDLKKAGAEGSAPDTPSVVTGLDGKTYPAVKPDAGSGADPSAPDEDEAKGPGADPSAPGSKGNAARSRKRLPKWMKPGNRPDPDHPFARILSLMTQLSAEFTKALSTEIGKKLFDYLLELQAHKLKCPPFVFNRMLVVAGKNYGPQFVWLRSIRRIVKLAGEEGKKRAATLVKEFAAAQDPESPEGGEE